MGSSSASKRWTEQDVVGCLKSIFPQPAHAVLSQVRNGTGYARSQVRTADAVVASCFPGRGLWLGGVEAKVSLSDWRQELAHPEKADEIQQYCHYWYAAAPVGIIPVGEVPEKWGLIECTARGSAKIVKAAVKNASPKPLDMLLLCSILRNVARDSVPIGDVHNMVEAKVAEQVASANRAIGYELQELKARIKQFEDASGVSLSDQWRFGRVGTIVKTVVALGSDNIVWSMDELRKCATRIIKDLDATQGKMALKEVKNVTGSGAARLPASVSGAKADDGLGAAAPRDTRPDATDRPQGRAEASAPVVAGAAPAVCGGTSALSTS